MGAIQASAPTPHRMWAAPVNKAPAINHHFDDFDIAITFPPIVCSIRLFSAIKIATTGTEHGFR